MTSRRLSFLRRPRPIGSVVPSARREVRDLGLFASGTDLEFKSRAIRGGLARLCAQAASFLIRIASLVILARLLNPRDFGLVGMVTALTGVLSLLRDFGLSSAAIQRDTVTEQQLSLLFWINIALGAMLWLATLAIAPAVAAFYRQPQLLGLTAALGSAFLFNAAGVQHSALLQRCLRFTALAVINVVALIVGTAIAIAGAMAGYGYWALAAMAIASPLVATVGFWFAAGWVPGVPRRGTEIRSMLGFGGSLTLTGMIVYVAYNIEKVLIGRVWGVDAIGIYGRAYQLISIPTENLNSAVGEVAFSALSRLQADPVRLRRYFLKVLAFVLGLSLPITIASALFADDLVFVLLGPHWKDAAAIVRLLAPTVTIFAIINPLGWLIFSMGMVARGVKAAPVLAMLMIVGYIIGLPYGPKGVALGYSAVLTLWVVPHVWWCVYKTPISFRDVLLTASRPLAAGLPAGALAFGVHLACGQSVAPPARLALESGVLFIAFYAILIFAAGYKSLYLELLRALRAPVPVGHQAFANRAAATPSAANNAV